MSKKSKIEKKFLTFRDTLQGEKICWEILEDLKFSDDVESQMDDVVRGFMMSGSLEAHAEERVDLKRIELDELRGELVVRAEEDIVERATEMRVKSWIDRDEQYNRKRTQVARYARQAKILKHLNKAFQIKAELIRTKAANLRQQYNDLGMSPPTVAKPKKKRRK